MRTHEASKLAHAHMHPLANLPCGYFAVLQCPSDGLEEEERSGAWAHPETRWFIIQREVSP